MQTVSVVNLISATF